MTENVLLDMYYIVESFYALNDYFIINSIRNFMGMGLEKKDNYLEESFKKLPYSRTIFRNFKMTL